MGRRLVAASVVLLRQVALSLLHLQKHDATVPKQCLTAHPRAEVELQPCVSHRVHEWQEECIAGGHEDALQPASRVGVQALQTARALCRERHLYARVRHQNVDKRLAPSNAAVWREHVTATDAAHSDASALAAHATTLRSRNQWIARSSRRWNVRRGFFKAGERLPLETRRAKAAFPFPFRAHAEKRGPKNGPQNRLP